MPWDNGNHHKNVSHQWPDYTYCGWDRSSEINREGPRHKSLVSHSAPPPSQGKTLIFKKKSAVAGSGLWKSAAVKKRPPPLSRGGVLPRLPPPKIVVKPAPLPPKLTGGRRM